MIRSAALALLLVSALAAPTAASAEPLRRARPHAVSGGLMIAGVGGGEALPFLTAQWLWNASAALALHTELAFFTSGDRVFGPRLLGRVGPRWYLGNAPLTLFVSGNLVAYHQFDVEISYSDASQNPGSSVALDATAGTEWTWPGGLTWSVEAGAGPTLATSGMAPDGTTWHAGTCLGYRF